MKRFRKEASVPDELKRADRVGVGIIETLTEADLRHPAFVVNAENVWMQSCHQPEPVATTTPAPKVRRFVEEDHGLHIAGILSAQAHSLAPGLAPNARLFHIPQNAALEDEVAAARDCRAKIFNVSFSFEEDGPNHFSDDSLPDLREKMSREWTDGLFVVSAGDEPRDLTHRDDAPATWSGDAATVITVGASHNGKICEWSSYGKRYVQLLAPGVDIPSTAGAHAYTVASGTSQAAAIVTATAARLKGLEPLLGYTQLKARLLYTSDWNDDLGDKVWAGTLNVGRALEHPDASYLIAEDGTEKLQIGTPSGTLTVSSSKLRKAIGDDVSPGEIVIDITNVLRLDKRGSKYRVFYLNGNQMHILHDASLSGQIKCVFMGAEVEKDFEENADLTGDWCSGTNVENIDQFVASAPPDPVQF